jgi:hypothetical protein
MMAIAAITFTRLGTIRAVAERYVSALDSEARDRGWKACFNQFAAL